MADTYDTKTKVCTDYCAQCTVQTIVFVSYTSIITLKTAINKSVVFSEWKGALHSAQCRVNSAKGSGHNFFLRMP
jgi:hypothetical protein